jgi:acetate kinase
MRCLLKAAPSNPDARLAIEMFCFFVRKQIAAMIAVLGGFELLRLHGRNRQERGAIAGSDLRRPVRSATALTNRGAALRAIPSTHSALRSSVQICTSREDEQIARRTPGPWSRSDASDRNRNAGS